MVFDRNGRWHDERGRFASPPPARPVFRRVEPLAIWEVTWNFSYRPFESRGPSPPLEDSAVWMFEGSKPTSGELFLAIKEIENGYLEQRIYIFNISSPQVTLGG